MKFYALQTPTGLSVICHAPLPMSHDHPAVVHALQQQLLLQVWARLCHLLYRHFRYVTRTFQRSHRYNTVSDDCCADGHLGSRIVWSIHIPGQNIFVMAVSRAVSFELPGDIFVLSYTYGSTKPFLTCKLLYRHILLTY